ncbi:MAG: hypothetical protein ACYS8W_14125 [Planctomycetota bacterium]
MGLALRERTISAALVERADKRIVARTVINHPRDFIPGGPEAADAESLVDATVRGANKAIKRARKNVGAGRNQIYAVSICVSDSARMELLSGVENTDQGEKYFAESLSLRAHRLAAAEFLPGAPNAEPLLVSSAIAAGLDEKTAPFAHMDISSAIRILIATENRFVTASAGGFEVLDAFGITHGVRPSRGAINAFEMEDNGWNPDRNPDKPEPLHSAESDKNIGYRNPGSPRSGLQSKDGSFRPVR